MLRKVILRAQLSSRSQSCAACTCEGLRSNWWCRMFSSCLHGQTAWQMDSMLYQHLLTKSSSVVFWMTLWSQAGQPPCNIAPHCIVKLFPLLMQKNSIGSTKNSTTQPKLGAVEGSEGIQFTAQGWTFDMPELYQRPPIAIHTQLGLLKR